MLEFSWHETSQVKYFGYLIEWRECFPGSKLLSSLCYKPIEAAFQTFRPGVSESTPTPTCCFCIGAPWIKCKKRQRSFYVPHLLNSSHSNTHIPSFTLLLKSLSQSCHCEDKWSSPEPGTGTLHSWPLLFSPLCFPGFWIAYSSVLSHTSIFRPHYFLCLNVLWNMYTSQISFNSQFECSLLWDLPDHKGIHRASVAKIILHHSVSIIIYY